MTTQKTTLHHKRKPARPSAPSHQVLILGRKGTSALDIVTQVLILGLRLVKRNWQQCQKRRQYLLRNALRKYVGGVDIAFYLAKADSLVLDEFL